MHTSLEFIVPSSSVIILIFCLFDDAQELLSNDGERSRRAQVALFAIGVKALHIIVRSLAQFLIRFSNGNTWRLMEISLCIPFDHYELESDIFGSCRTSTTQKKAATD